MKRPRVVLSSPGVRGLLDDARVRAELARRADAIVAAAHASAPVQTGAYRASIHRESATTDRAVERVVADAPHALIVEARTGNLARALEAGR